MSGTTDAKVRSRVSFLPDYNEQDHLSRYLDEPVCRLGNAFRLYDKNQPVCRRINSLNSQYYTGCPESRCTNLKHKCVSHGEMKKKKIEMPRDEKVVAKMSIWTRWAKFLDF